MQRFGELFQRAQPFGEMLRPAPRGKHVPVRQARALAAAPENRFQHPVVVLDRAVFEQVAEIEAIEGIRARTIKNLLHREAVPLETIEARANRVEVLSAERARQRVAVGAGEDPVHVRVLGRIQLPQRMCRALQDRRGDIFLDLAEELGVAAESAHDRAR